MSEVFIVASLILSAIAAISVIFFLFRKSASGAGETEAIRDLERRLTDLVIGQLKEMRVSADGTSRTLHEQIRSFTKETTHIRENLREVQEAVKDVSSFQEIFKSPKLKGQWGEASLEHILAQHFPRELYTAQHLFSSGEQVDAVLKLPNGMILPIDSKFPSENFDKMVNAANETEKNFYKKGFLEDVKVQVQSMAQKYIVPAEGTTDFAIMYIPAEAVYYEIINNISKEVDVAGYAWSKRVILASPNTLYLALRTIEHWFRDSQISTKTQDILRKLGRISQDAEKLMDDFRKLGSHIRNASSAYDVSEKRLSLFGDRVEKLIDLGEKKELKNKNP